MSGESAAVHYGRFLAGASDGLAIDGWCAVMDARDRLS